MVVNIYKYVCCQIKMLLEVCHLSFTKTSYFQSFQLSKIFIIIIIIINISLKKCKQAK